LYQLAMVKKLKLFSVLNKLSTMQWRRMMEWMHRSTCFLTSALVGDEWLALRRGRFTPGERAPGTHPIEGRVGSRAGLDDMEKRKFLFLPWLELRFLVRAARSQSPCRQRYPDSFYQLIISILYVQS
jgi:hypothetical protein